MKTLLFLFPWLVLATALQAQDSGVSEVRWDPEPFLGHYRTRSGPARLEGRLGRIVVPEQRGSDSEATVELAFVLYETENPEPGPPVFWLVGGPGGSGVEHAASFAAHPLLPVLDHCDVIALDQRGTGLSLPNLADGPDLSYPLPLDRAWTQREDEEAFAEMASEGYEYWSEKGVGLEHFNTVESADDIDDLRRALGFERIVVWGGSYGSHLGLAYLRRHGEHVARAILTKVEGPDHTLKLPSTVQRHLEQLAELVAADARYGESLPDLMGTVEELLALLEREPVTARVPGPGGEVEVTVGPYDLRRELSNALGGLREISRIPGSLVRMRDGDWSQLASRALANRSGEVGSMMTVMMDCASWASEGRVRRIEREAADPKNLLGDAINAPFSSKLRRAVGKPDLGESFRSSFESPVPMLLVTGSLDVRTPPENVTELIDGWPHAVHLEVIGVSHDSFEMLSPEYVSLVRAFLLGEPVESQVIDVPAMRFE